MECRSRRRISGNDYNLYAGYVNQTHEITNAIFTCTDDVFYIKNKTNASRNIYTYANGDNIGTSAATNATPWISFKSGDIVDVILYDINVETAGTDYIQMYTTTGSYYRNLGQITLDSGTDYIAIRREMTADGTIPGIQHAIGAHCAYSYKLKIYVNGIRFI